MQDLTPNLQVDGRTPPHPPSNFFEKQPSMHFRGKWTVRTCVCLHWIIDIHVCLLHKEIINYIRLNLVMHQANTLETKFHDLFISNNHFKKQYFKQRHLSCSFALSDTYIWHNISQYDLKPYCHYMALWTYEPYCHMAPTMEQTLKMQQFSEGID